MSTVSRDLPERPHLAIPKREARELLNQWRAARLDALDRIRRRHPKFRATDDSSLKTAIFRLSDAQLVIAREYGFSNWAELKKRVSSNTLAGQLRAAIHADDCEEVVRLLELDPELLHIPIWSGNWGPPMSHAANLGRLEIVKTVAALGARDIQHAFDRAVLQGKIECAKWLHAQGAKLLPGIIMGACETLNAAGLRFLVDLGAPVINAHGDRLAPLALVLETYCRNPHGKHAVLDIFAQRGYQFPETPMMAFHCGRVDRLTDFLRNDPSLIRRRFDSTEIYPTVLGCAADGRAGLHGTPLHGTTLLHLAIDFDEREVFDLLLSRGADVNGRATVDEAGFGGHTPLFNAIVSQAYACGRQRDAYMVRALLEHGASPTTRVNLRKFLDWCEQPGWHEALAVTPAEWAHRCPEPGWVNREALPLLDRA